MTLLPLSSFLFGQTAENDNNTKKTFAETLATAWFYPCTKWPSVKGASLSRRDLKDLLTPRALFDYLASKKQENQLTTSDIGEYLTHRALWQFLAENKIPQAAVFQDKVEFDPIESLNFETCFRELPPNYDLFVFGYDAPPQESLSKHPAVVAPAVSPGFQRIFPCRSDFQGALGYVITLRAAKVLLAKSLPIDSRMDAYMTSFCLDLNIFFSKTQMVRRKTLFRSSPKSSRMLPSPSEQQSNRLPPHPFA